MENATGNVGSPLKATDDDGDILTYSLADGDDNDLFSIDRATGQLMVGSAGLDFEMPRGRQPAIGNTNDYVVMVTATDSHGISSEPVTVTVTVTDVNDAPTFGAVDDDAAIPVNIQGMADDHREDTESLVIAAYTATDPEGADVTLSLMGDDAALFELADDTDTTASANRLLSFKEEPDFENPGDQNGDNVYEVTVRASDSILNTDIELTIKVTDADEAGEVEVPQDALIRVELTATLTDSDTGAPDPAQFIDQVWSWHRLATADAPINADSVIAGAGSSSYTPVVADRGMFLRARVTYTDRTRDEDNEPSDNTAGENFVGFTNTVTSNATTPVRNNPSNQRPVFEEGSSTVRLVEENTKALTDPDDDEVEDNPADNVGGGPVVAMDVDGDTVNYTLTGSDMFRVRTNGQIEVSDKAKLNYEDSRSHTVTLTANDALAKPIAPPESP